MKKSNIIYIVLFIIVILFDVFIYYKIHKAQRVIIKASKVITIKAAEIRADLDSIEAAKDTIRVDITKFYTLHYSIPNK